MLVRMAKDGGGMTVYSVEKIVRTIIFSEPNNVHIRSNFRNKVDLDFDSLERCDRSVVKFYVTPRGAHDYIEYPPFDSVLDGDYEVNLDSLEWRTKPDSV